MAYFTLRVFYHNRKGQVTINSQVKANWYPESSLSKYCKQNCNSCSLWIILRCHILRKQNRIRDLICWWDQSGVKAERTMTTRHKTAADQLAPDCALTAKHKLLRVPLSYQQSWGTEQGHGFPGTTFKSSGVTEKTRGLKTWTPTLRTQ